MTGFSGMKTSKDVNKTRTKKPVHPRAFFRIEPRIVLVFIRSRKVNARMRNIEIPANNNMLSCPTQPMAQGSDSVIEG